MTEKRSTPLPFPLLAVICLCLTVLQASHLSLGSLPLRLVVAGFFLLFFLLSLVILKKEGVNCHQLLFAALPIAVALLLRVLLFDHATLDYQDFLSKWVEHFRQNGGFSAIKDPIGNYNVPYLYMLAALSYLPLPDLYGIKLFSVLFDVLLAWGGMRLAKAVSDNSVAPCACFCTLLLTPTVLLNGACWGQCDSVWGALCLWALATALENRPILSVSLLALAFSFKLQAIFIIPLWCALWFARRIKFRHLFAFPTIFFLTMLPALLAGKPLSDILGVYLDQAGSSIAWQTVNYNSPSVFALLPYRFNIAEWVPKAAIGAAFLFMLFILLLLFLHRSRLGAKELVTAGAVFSLGIPFLLPYMHERYFFLGTVLLIVLACTRPSKQLGSAVCSELASLGGYHAYLRQRYFLPLTLFGITWAQPIEGVCMLFSVTHSTTALLRSLRKSKKTDCDA